MQSNNSGKKTFSDINVTPLVDVMLVLLVIFMVTAPLMHNGISLTLPKTKKVHQLNLSDKQVIISVSKSGEYFVGKSKVLFNEILGQLTSAVTQSKNKTVYLRADYGLKYGKVAYLMSHLRSNGFENIALVTEIENKK